MNSPFPFALWPHNGGLRKALGNSVNPGRQVTGASAGPSLKVGEIGHFNALAAHGAPAHELMGLQRKGVTASDPDHQIASAAVKQFRPAALQAMQGLQGTTLGTHLSNFNQARTNWQSLENSGADENIVSAARQDTINHANAAGSHVFGERGWQEITKGNDSHALQHMNAVAHPALFQKAQ